MNNPVLLCLHGWGGSKESFDDLKSALRGTKIIMLTPDLPGFGEEPDPARPFDNDAYAKWVEEWLDKRLIKNEKKLNVLGHSHGGRIAIKLAIRKKIRIRNLFLCAPAGIRHSRHIKRITGLLLAKGGQGFLFIPGIKLLKPIFKKILYILVREHDYEKASAVMRQTMLKVTREDFRPYLNKINLPTDLFWGAKDKMTPLKDGRLMNKQIANSTLHVYQGVTHKVHRVCAEEIAGIIKKRLMP